MQPRRRIRVGIDTGGTFTDVVALDEDTGELVTTKTPSTPANPADGFLAGIDKVLALMGGPAGDSIGAVSHGTTVATNQLLEGKVGPARVHHHRGVRRDARDRAPVGARRLRQLLLLGEAAPDRAARPGARRSVAGSTSPARRCGPSTRRARARSPAGSGPAASTPSASASCTPTPTPARGADARDPDRGASRRGGQHQQRGAARVPRVRASDDDPRRRRREAPALGVRREHRRPARGVRRRSLVGRAESRPRERAVLRDEVERRRAQRGGGGAPADHHRAERPGGGCPRCGVDRAGGGLRPGADLRRRRHLDRRLGGRRRAADADHRGVGRRVPEQDPDDRRGDGRRGRRLDRVAVAGGCAQGGPAVGRCRPGPALLRPRRHRRHHHRRTRGPRADPTPPAGR